MATTATALLTAVGCGGDDAGSESDEPGAPSVSLVSAEQVGGDPLPSAETEISTSSPCHLDGSQQWVGASNENSDAFEREVDGGTEKVVLGVIERDAEYAREGLGKLRERLKSAYCRSGQSNPPKDTWSSEIVPGFGPNTVVFRSIVTIGPTDTVSEEDAAAQGRTSYLRAYRQLGDHMIFVWLERHDAGDPSIDDLRRLLDEQTALTKQASAAVM